MYPSSHQASSSLTSLVLKSITSRIDPENPEAASQWNLSSFPGVDILSNGRATFTVASGGGYPKRLKVMLSGESSEPRLLAEARLDEHRIEKWLETVLSTGLTTVRTEKLRSSGKLEDARIRELAFQSGMAFLQSLIAGREQADQPVRPQVFGAKTIGVIRLPVGDSLLKLKIHADCRCSAIQKFLDKARLGNLSVAQGPSGGNRLGIDGAIIDHLYIYA